MPSYFNLVDFLIRYPIAWEVLLKYWKEYFFLNYITTQKYVLLLGHYYGMSLEVMKGIQEKMTQRCEQCHDSMCVGAVVRLASDFKDYLKEKHVKSILLGRLSHYRIFIMEEDRGGVMIELPELTAPPKVMKNTHVWAHARLRTQSTELLREGIFPALETEGNLHYFEDWDPIIHSITRKICELVQNSCVLNNRVTGYLTQDA